ncbi:hypothetical protein CALVIDRAFT_597500 [Calocera viscosa TUFC12733]|uniref:Uncharacterized protein n=1 Tax=Calocera viscosa (strain TUFC12733) TaxID=1330018 RepID=A0A167ND55_CALVF|nr:hypothetical protein CALVIDRAFT_597500 [Calocera viscosa TUFC12733]
MYDLNTCMLYGIFLSAILYGIHVILFVLSLYVLIFKRGSQQRNFILVVLSTIMFILETSVIALSFSRILDGFIGSGSITSAEAALYFAELSLPKYMAHAALLGVNVILADALLIYRCWIVFNRRIIFVTVNILLWITSTVFLGITLTRLKLVTLSTPETLEVVSTSDWTWIALSLTQTILTTAMIVYRIWRAHLLRQRPEEQIFRSVATIILESGALYMTALIVYAITIHVAEGVLSNITVDIASPPFRSLNSVLGISFSLVIVRIGLGLSQISGLPSNGNSSDLSHPTTFNLSIPNPRGEDLEAGQAEPKEISPSTAKPGDSPI